VVWFYVVITPWKTLCRSTSSQGMSPILARKRARELGRMTFVRS